jgi:hypothetical protein
VGVWSASHPGRLYPRERPGTHCTGGWVGPGAGLDGCGKSRPTWIRSPDLPARSESLYRLRHPGTTPYNTFLILWRRQVGSTVQVCPVHLTTPSLRCYEDRQKVFFRCAQLTLTHSLFSEENKPSSVHLKTFARWRNLRISIKINMAIMLTWETPTSYLFISCHNWQHRMVMQTSDVETTMTLFLKFNKKNRPSKNLQTLFIISPAIKE